MNRVQFYQTFVSIWQINPTDLSQIKFKSESTMHRDTINMFHLPESLFHYRTSIQKSCNAKEERQHGGCFLSTNLNCPTIQPNASTIQEKFTQRKVGHSFAFVFLIKLIKGLGNDIIGKNITFTCESCFMADLKMIDFPANLPAQFNRRKEFRSTQLSRLYQLAGYSQKAQ